MVTVKFPSSRKISNRIKKASISLGTVALISSLISCGNSTEYDTTEVLSPTQGIVTKIKEVKQELFKITDEDIVAAKEDSRIIASFLDGEVDTFTLEEARLVEAENPRRRGMSGILMGGMMGYMMGRSMGTPLNRSAYANDAAFNKSNSTNSKFRSTASRKTVSKPKSGFGSSKSSKSYGG